METPSDALLAQYLAGDCSPADARWVERWMGEDPANRARFDELRAIWEARRLPFVPDVESVWAGVRRSMQADAARSAPGTRPVRFFAPRRWWASPAAAAALAVLAAGASLAIARTYLTNPGTVAVEPMREYATPRGQRATFQLADGSRLILAPESRLRVPANYGHGIRQVYLDGEALFAVIHDSTRPFRVHASHAVIQDIGTRFDVRAYPGDAAVAVAVAEGSVALGRASARGTSADASTDAADAAQGVVLRGGQLGTLDPTGRVTTTSGAATDAYLSWTEGRLRFVEAPLPQVLRVVGRWYDLDIRVGDPVLAARSVTAEFGTQSADDVVRALAIALGARITRSGRIVTLHPK